MSGTAPSVGGFRQLPDALSDLTERVVRGTWLWPSEKRDVRKELESHFREGIFELTQEGKSLDESVALLRDEFGDPDLAAKLIRRGKKRGRPMLWKAFVSIALVSVVVLGAGAGYFAYVTLASPTPSVDYVARINEPTQRIAEQDRAWPQLREVIFEMLPTLEQFGMSKESLPKPGTADWEKIAPALASARPFVPRIAVAVNKPSFGYLYGKEGTDYLKRRNATTQNTAENVSERDPLMPPTIGLLLPHLVDLKKLTSVLILNTRDMSAKGDLAGAWQSLDASHRLGMHLLGGRTLIEQLVGCSIVSRTTDEMRSTLYQWRDRLTPDNLAMIRSSQVMTASMEPFKPTLKGEEYFFEDVVQYVFTDDGNGNGRFIPSQFTKVVTMGMETGANQELKSDAYALSLGAMHADRRETMSKYHEVLDRAVEYWSLPLYDQRRSDGDALVKQMADDLGNSKRYALIGFLLPALSRADQSIRETGQSESATRAIVGLLSFKADNQTMPARLSEIAPKYICEVPSDIYSGMFMKYVRGEDGQTKLYSVGKNLRDDGGSQEKVEDPTRQGMMIEADKVYWPAE